MLLEPFVPLELDVQHVPSQCFNCIPVQAPRRVVIGEIFVKLQSGSLTLYLGWTERGLEFLIISRGIGLRTQIRKSGKL